jgi:transcriptional antiterminator RfaH
MVATASTEQLLYPLDLLSMGAGEGGAAAGDWWLLHTRSRQEKVVAQELLRLGHSLYLPLVQRRSMTRGRPRVASVPLFPGYVFLFGDGNARLAALKTNRLAAVHEVADGDKLRQDLSTVASLISIGAPLTPEDRLEPGQRVRIKSGPCCGLEGTLVKRHGRGKLVVWISQLLQGASVEIDDCTLEAV